MSKAPAVLLKDATSVSLQLACLEFRRLGNGRFVERQLSFQVCEPLEFGRLRFR